MSRSILILLALGIIVALPFALRQRDASSDWTEGDPTLVIVSPHNEAIRYEFEQAFSDWYRAKYKRPVKIEWRSVGGTTEIIRYLSAEFAADTRALWKRQGRPWPENGSEVVVSRDPPTSRPGADGIDPVWEKQMELYRDFRRDKTPGEEEASAHADLFFGGGEFDHSTAFRQGLTVAPWPEKSPPAEMFAMGGVSLIPEKISGETWRTAALFGNAVSTFGICFNRDRLRDLGIERTPEKWEDLADFKYFRQVGLADPTKSGSIAKAFEMLVHARIHDRVIAAGFSDAQIDDFEQRIDALQKARKLKAWELPPDIPPSYQAAIESGWTDGMSLVQKIGANQRYFTDSASKVPIDVSMGDAAVGMAIDFYARYQAECGPKMTDPATGEMTEVMGYVTPRGGSSVSCDPISLLRGAPHRETAVRFIEFVLSEEGQRLWCYRPGEPGGPRKYALRRLPIRREFYPSTNPVIQAAYERHASHTVDDLADPKIDPYMLAAQFTYQPRWTAKHFGIQRDLVRAMCIDSWDELREAWDAINHCTDAARREKALAVMSTLPTVRLTDREGKAVEVSINWREVVSVPARFDKLDYMSAWTRAFAANYNEAKKIAEGN